LKAFERPIGGNIPSLTLQNSILEEMEKYLIIVGCQKKEASCPSFLHAFSCLW
jgi:hypothetical protein